MAEFAPATTRVADAGSSRSAFAPLRHRDYRWLWTAFAVSSLGIWMQTFGAQWYLVIRADGAPYVALVQTAMTLPMAMLALPGGVLADVVDRRRLLIVVQLFALAVSTALAVLAVLGRAGIWPLLILTVAVGSSNALSLAPFQSLIPDLVSRSEIPAGAALTAVGANVARAVGPALAGVVVAVAGAPLVFAIVAATCAMFVAVLWAWRGDVAAPRPREGLIAAVCSGVRYVRHSPAVLKLMLRSFWFTTGMVAMFALLPLLATRNLGLDSTGYGILVGCIGAGAVVGGLSTARLRGSLGPNALVLLGFLIGVAVMATVPFAPYTLVAAGLLVAAGWAWTMTLSTLATAMQLYLPAWVRARGLALYWLAMFGGQAIGSVLLGLCATRLGLSTAFLVAAGVLVVGATMAFWLPLRRLEDLDRTPSSHWPEPSLSVDPDEIRGEVVVQWTYWVDADDEPEFVARMVSVRRVRLRTGGRGWRLLKDAETPRHFIEEYSVRSWREHQNQQRHRLVVSDHELERQAAELSCGGSPVVARLFRYQLPDEHS